MLSERNMDENPVNSSVPELSVAPDDNLPKLVVLQATDDFYYPYSRSSIYSSLFISSLLFFVFFILLVVAIIQCKRSTRIPHEEFALIPTGPVPGYMTIVHTRYNGRDATSSFHLYPKTGSTSGHYSDRAVRSSEEAPPSYQSMTRDSDLPTYQSVQPSSDNPSTSASQPTTISPISCNQDSRIGNTSNPFVDRTNSGTTQSEVDKSSNPFLDKAKERLRVLSDSESFTDDDVFYEVDACSSPTNQNLQYGNEQEENQEKKT